MAQPYPVTTIPCTRSVGGHAFTGRYWKAHPVEVQDVDRRGPAQLAATIAANAIYRAQNYPVENKYVLVEAYLGVEFSYQPVGTRRLRPALMRAPWAPQDCTRWGPLAIQGYGGEGFAGGTREEWQDDNATNYAASGTREAEDSNRLNIWVPTGKAPAGGWGVVLFMHPGGSNYFSTMPPSWRPHRAVAEGLIVCSLEYRLGTLGTWWHPSMPSDADYQGVNFGLTDAIAALEWLHEYIADFGGNASLITTTGGSAGGSMCASLLVHPYAKTLHRRSWMDSASWPTNTRWQFGPYRHTKGIEQWHGVRHAALNSAASYIKDSQNPARPWSEAIAEKGFLAAVRENLDIATFMALDGGGRDFTGQQLQNWTPLTAFIKGARVVYEGRLYQVIKAGYTSSASFWTDYGTDPENPINDWLVRTDKLAVIQGRGLTTVNDGITVFHSNNRAAAIAGAFDGAHDVVCAAGQQESSVIGYGLLPFSWNRELDELSGETWAEYLAGPVVNTDHNGAPVAWSSYEVNRNTFNFAYQHGARRISQAVTEAGGTAWLLYGNYVVDNTGTRMCGHGWTTTMMLGNPHYKAPATLAQPTIALVTANDVRVSDGLVKALRNFVYTGNLNTDPGLPDSGLNLFADDWGQTFVPYSVTDKNWNVVGSVPYRSANACTPDVTNRPGFWTHAFDHFETMIGDV